MSYFQAVVLAIVQGLSEFLPISSSAHLILFPSLLGWQDQGLAFDVAVHVGTLLAVVFFLRREIQQIVPAWFAGFKGWQWDEQGLLAWWIVLATIPVGLAGWVLGDWIEMNLRSVVVIAWATLLFGLVLAWADARSGKNNRPLASLKGRHAWLTGLAQMLALIPGTSRSGVTMSALLALGYSRLVAVRFSFLLAIPAIALPGLLKGFQLYEFGEAVAWDILLLGVVVSALVAFLTMHWFMAFVERVGLKVFVVYRVILALFLFVSFS